MSVRTLLSVYDADRWLWGRNLTSIAEEEGTFERSWLFQISRVRRQYA